MTTTTTTLTIVCPEWCTVDPAVHTRDLWDCGGEVFHHGPDIKVPDPGPGPCHGYDDELRPPDPITLSLLVTTNPEGRETATPALIIGDRERSFEQALALCAAITEAIATYRAAGGVA